MVVEEQPPSYESAVATQPPGKSIYAHSFSVLAQDSVTAKSFLTGILFGCS